jgi:hypothetical protein
MLLFGWVIAGCMDLNLARSASHVGDPGFSDRGELSFNALVWMFFRVAALGQLSASLA